MVKSQFYNSKSLDIPDNTPSSSRSLQQHPPHLFSWIKHGLPLLATLMALAHLWAEGPSMSAMFFTKPMDVRNVTITGGNYSSNNKNHSQHHHQHHSNSTNRTITANTSTSPVALETTSKEEPSQTIPENSTSEATSPTVPTPIPPPPLINSSTIFIHGPTWLANQTHPPNNGQPTIFSCHDDGNAIGELRSILMDVLPEYRFVSLLGIGRAPDLSVHGPWLDNLPTTDQDVFITPVGRGCTVGVDRWRTNPQHYTGKFILTSGEDANIPEGMANITYFWGPRNPSPDNQHHVLRLTYLQLIFWLHFRRQGQISNTGAVTPTDSLFHFPRNASQTKPHFLMYGQSNCVPFREEAMDRISEIAPVHIGGKCRGRIESVNKTAVVTQVNLFNWWKNVHVYSQYRFCLVMEHSNSSGYMTEKILMAFGGGCIPIYYGTREIFEFFNEQAFVFYDIHNPEPALARITYLESNASAYDAIMKEEPVLARGQATIRDYFSFSDDVGGGVLKAKMRSMLGLSNAGFSMASISNENSNNPGPSTRLRRALRSWLE